MLRAPLGAGKQDSSRVLLCALNPVLGLTLPGASISHGVSPDSRLIRKESSVCRGGTRCTVLSLTYPSRLVL